MESRREEAITAKEIALERMKEGDFLGGLEFSTRAQQLCPDLENIVQMILVCEVHCSGGERVGDNEKNWYKILKIDPTAGVATIKKHYSQLVLGLHPDKNRFPGADEAFHLAVEAKNILINEESRRVYDSRCQSFSLSKAKAWAQGLHPKVTKVELGKTSSSLLEKPKRGRKPKKGLPEEGSDCKMKMTKPRKRVKFSQQEAEASRSAGNLPNAKTCGSPGNHVSEISPGQLNLEYPGPQLNDFDKTRGVAYIKPGQIWAVYDSIDALPRFYALINDALETRFKLNVTWLEPCPENREEANWLYMGLPASCGKFKLGQSEIIEDNKIFSHIVFWKRAIISYDVYQIYPKKGETWAVFQNWDIRWWMDPNKQKCFKFEVVEILSEYDCNAGVSVAFLDKVEGNIPSVFSRSSGCGVIEAKERLRFSHRVPSVRIKRDGRVSENEVLFELDCAALPANFTSSETM